MNLTSPREIKNILERHGFSFTKSLGQNFLIDQNIVDKIIEKSDVKGKNILEIGPGIGSMTKSLCKVGKKVVAVEIDKSLKPILEETLGKENNLEIVFEDILKVDVKKLTDEKFNGESFKVVANLPYYITTPILINLLKSEANIDELIVMMQKEVADRIVASPSTKEYGSISVFLRFFGDSEIILKVPKTVFMPQPKVGSAVLKLKLRENIELEDVNNLEKVLRAGFQKRRKTILNSLSSGLNIEKSDLKKVLNELDIEENKRAENLDLDDYLALSRKLINEGDLDD